MRVTLLLILLTFLYNGELYSQEVSFTEEADVPKVNFSLEIQGINDIVGEVRIAIFDTREKYEDKEEPIFAVVLPVVDDKLIWTKERFPVGSYAIAVYHDKNKNGQLDSNIVGIPKEPYGFSNDARGRFGPASWNDAKFEVTNTKTEHIIELR